MKAKMATVVVPYARNRIAYAICKSLKRAGHKVIAADSTPLAMCRWSKYVDGFEVYRTGTDAEFLQWAIRHQWEGHLIFPTFMEAWKLVAVHKVLPDIEIIWKANSKQIVHELCESLGIPAPWGRYMEQGVIKPAEERGATGRRYFERAVVQERVAGEAIGVGMLFNKGRLKAKFCWRRLKEYPKDGGLSVVRESYRAPEQEANAQELMEVLGWHGPAMVEFKGQYVLEVNPQFWGGLALAIESGVDFPRLTVDIMEKGDCEEVKEWEVGVKCSWLAGCIRRGCKPQGILEDWSKDDPLPFLGQFALPVWNFIKDRGTLSLQTSIMAAVWFL